MNKALKTSTNRFYRKWRIKENRRIFVSRMNAIVAGKVGMATLSAQASVVCKTKEQKVAKGLAVAKTIIETHLAIGRALRLRL